MSGWEDPYCLAALAAASAEIGRFDEAVKWMKKALEYPSSYAPQDIEKDREALKLYGTAKPYRDE